MNVLASRERGDVLWVPTAPRIAGSAVHRFARSVLEDVVAEPDGPQAVGEYEALWRWSVADLGRFWTSVLGWFDPPAPGRYHRL